MKEFQRAQAIELQVRLLEKRKFIQVVSGPRQVGKTTLIKQVLGNIQLPYHFISGDQPSIKSKVWLDQEFESARSLLGKAKSAVLVIDECQKIIDWSEIVKKNWDSDSFNNVNLKVVLLGSSPLLIHKGLSESLAGRFETIQLTHWSFSEMKEAFKYSMNDYVLFGAYPGSASLKRNPDRYTSYIRDSLIEATISQDILQMEQVNKPALLRQVFELACQYSGQMLSYRKMLGQLHDAGNTTTLAHYLKLLDIAGMVVGLEKYSGKVVQQKSSSPKLLVRNTALMTIVSGVDVKTIYKDPKIWGRHLESCIGAHILNQARLINAKAYYWRNGDLEVDFVIEKGNKLTAIEVGSSTGKSNLPGMDEFAKRFPHARTLLVGPQGIDIEIFLSEPLETWL